ncbi:TPA: flavin monoamine oxidase family protein [Pseudomonas aeruginosa]
MKTQKIAIVGGGLAGLYAAYRLQKMGVAFDLFEARNRLGGRILSTPVGRLDLGPTWFWPDYQPRMQQLLADLGLETFEQHEQGDAVVERGLNEVLRHPGYRSGNTSMRIVGGCSLLIDALAKSLPSERLHLGSALLSIQQANDGIELITSDGQAQDCRYRRVWLSIPPRLAGRVRFSPALSEQEQRLLTEVGTWMAAHAKYVARYDRPFWRERQLSGDAYSAMGPLGEIHDASNEDVAALFGFFGINASQRRNLPVEGLKAHCREQLARLFGPDAAEPLEDHIQDWSAEPFTATEDDRIPPRWHGTHDLSGVLQSHWKGLIRLIGSEAGGAQGGYMEGAILAVDEAVAEEKAAVAHA